MKEDSLDFIKSEFMNIYAAIRDLSDDEILNGPEDIFHPHLERLNRFAALDVNDHTAEEILGDREFQLAAKRICQVKANNGVRMEIECAQSIIASPDPWSQVKRFIYYPNYLQLARMEY